MGPKFDILHLRLGEYIPVYNAIVFFPFRRLSGLNQTSTHRISMWRKGRGLSLGVIRRAWR